MELNLPKSLKIIDLLSKMGIKKGIIEYFKERKKVERQILKLNRKLLSFVPEGTEVTKELNNKLLLEHEEIADQLADLQTDMDMSFYTLALGVMEQVPQNEKLFYKTLGQVFEISEEELKTQPLMSVVKQIFEVIGSDEFKQLF